MCNNRFTKRIYFIFFTFLLFLLFTGCTYKVEGILKNNIPDEDHIHFKAQVDPLNIGKLDSFSSAVVKIDELSPSVKINNKFEIKTFSGFKNNLRKNKDIEISNIVLADSGQRVMDEGIPANGEIKPDYNGKTIILNITGKFNTAPKIKLENMIFTNEAGLVHQSLVGFDPIIRVTLDDVILFTPVSVSNSIITVKIDTRGIPDLYLKGDHKLTVSANRYYTDTLIKVGDPEPVAKITPGINSVEVIRDEFGKPLNLKITGYNHMLYYRFAYIQVNGQSAFGHMTNVLDNGTWESIIHIPNPGTFDSTNEHSVAYTTPFGMAFKSF